MFIEIETIGQLDRLTQKIERYDIEFRKFFGDGPTATTEEHRSWMTNPAPTNEERSAVETCRFKLNKHVAYGCYVSSDSKSITTWIGQPLGKIISAGVVRRKGTISAGWFSFVAEGINGLTYKGLGHPGMACTIRVKKGGVR